MASNDRAHTLCVAPMMAWTDVHCRALHRALSPHARLYTEMVSTDAMLHGERVRQLRFDTEQQPIAVQLGGSNPADLAVCAKRALDLGFAEVNLNIGCPSDRVQRGTFGACLMRDPTRVAAAVAAISDATGSAPTIKCRLGVADRGADTSVDYARLCDFVGAVADAGARTFIVHARIAVLGGLSPAQNREVPPLRHDLVRRLTTDFPRLTVIVNGGLRDTEAVTDALQWADGVMVGRGAYQNPFWLCELESAIFGHVTYASPMDAAAAFEPYIERALAAGDGLHDVTRHMLGLFSGMPGARAYRRHLSEHARRSNASIESYRVAVSQVLDRSQDPLAA